MRPVKIAALFVETNGIYFGLPNIEPWDVMKDARNYKGPYPVIAHPPCARWCKLAPVNHKRWGTPIGDDGGCFAFALDAVMRYGGVLEHPAGSLAWKEYDLQTPKRGSWQKSEQGYWVTEVSQVAYGCPARKRTWLLLNGDPIPLDWSEPTAFGVIGGGINTGQSQGRPKIGKQKANATPIAFRDLLIALVNGPPQTET